VPTCRCKIRPTLVPHDLHIFSSLTCSSHSLQQEKPKGGQHSQNVGLDSATTLSYAPLFWEFHYLSEALPFMNTSITNEVDYHL
jgi:hypothetical protein